MNAQMPVYFGPHTMTRLILRDPYPGRRLPLLFRRSIVICTPCSKGKWSASEVSGQGQRHGGNARLSPREGIFLRTRSWPTETTYVSKISCETIRTDRMRDTRRKTSSTRTLSTRVGYPNDTTYDSLIQPQGGVVIANSQKT